MRHSGGGCGHARLFCAEHEKVGDTIFAVGLALWAGAGAGQAIADEPPGYSIFWQGCEPAAGDPWYVSSEGLALQRLFRGLGPIATEGPSPTGTLALSQQNLDEPFNAGVQFLVGHTFDDSPYQVEVSYFWLNPWNTSAQAVDPTGNLFSPFTTPFGIASRAPSRSKQLRLDS